MVSLARRVLGPSLISALSAIIVSTAATIIVNGSTIVSATEITLHSLFFYPALYVHFLERLGCLLTRLRSRP